jgi:aldehyde reductase
MAYSPIEQARLAGHAGLRRLAADLGATAVQVALAWLLDRPGVIAIPKSGHVARVEENAAARDLVLPAEAKAALDRMFPPPRGPHPLEML